MDVPGVSETVTRLQRDRVSFAKAKFSHLGEWKRLLSILLKIHILRFSSVRRTQIQIKHKSIVIALRRILCSNLFQTKRVAHIRNTVRCPLWNSSNLSKSFPQRRSVGDRVEFSIACVFETPCVNIEGRAGVSVTVRSHRHGACYAHQLVSVHVYTRNIARNVRVCKRGTHTPRPADALVVAVHRTASGSHSPQLSFDCFTVDPLTRKTSARKISSRWKRSAGPSINKSYDYACSFIFGPGHYTYVRAITVCKLLHLLIRYVYRRTLRRVIYERTFIASVIERVPIELVELTDTNRSGVESLRVLLVIRPRVNVFALSRNRDSRFRTCTCLCQKKS